MNYVSNPKRGCGYKVAGGFYAECEFGAGGILSPWTWVLGDGLEGGVNCLAAAPPRRTVYGNLAGSLVLGELVGSDVPLYFVKDDEAMVYEGLKQRSGTVALFDHVGSKFYTAWSFAEECKQYGPSRRLSPVMARELAGQVPLPIVFTHGRMPLFRSVEARSKAIWLMNELIDGFVLEDYGVGPTWLAESWGIYSGMENGADSWLRPLLSVWHRLEKDWHLVKDNPLFQEAKVIFDNCLLVEQLFGVSWITKVGYVPEKEEDVQEVAQRMGKMGIGVIDLEAEGEQ